MQVINHDSNAVIINSYAAGTSMLPEFLWNAVETINVSTRVILRTAQGVERSVAGIDQLATTLLRQQQERLLGELSNRPQLT